MDLDIFDKIIKNPAAADIARALDAAAFPKDWFITLNNGDASLKAMAQPDGSFIITHASGKQRRKAHADVATVKTVFLKYFARDSGWRGACKWDVPSRASASCLGAKLKFVRDTRTLSGRNNPEPPAWAILAMIGLFGTISFLASWPQVAYWLCPVAAGSDYFWAGLIFLPLVALLVLAIANKAFEFHRAASWSQTSGRIVSSTIEQRRHQFQDEPATIENFAAVSYDFTADGRQVRGSRIGIGDDYRGADAAPTMARYPVGSVVTVYYDPADPRNCVLERSGPPGFEARGCFTALIELAIAGAIVWALIAHGPAAVSGYFPKANANFAVAIFGVGLLLAMMFYAYWRRSRQAQGWPLVRGKIVEITSNIEPAARRQRDHALSARRHLRLSGRRPDLSR